jgi:hypothetical protein
MDVGGGVVTAPSLVSPISGTVAVNEPVALSWSTAEFQSAFHVRMRTAAATTWDALDTGLIYGQDKSYVIAANALASADYEWQIGIVVPTLYPSDTTYPDTTVHPSYEAVPATQFSASAFFYGRLRPAAPTVLAPLDGETIDKSRYTVRWDPSDLPGVVDAQTRYQVRRTTLDGAVRADSGEVVGTAQEHVINLQSSDVHRRIEVRQFFDGLWSPWASHQVYVFFVGPPFPLIVLVPDDTTASILVGITNPAPGAQQPAAVANDVFRRFANQVGDGIRLAAGLAPGVDFTDRTPASGQPYAYRVVAYGSDGNPTSTDWQE